MSNRIRVQGSELSRVTPVTQVAHHVAKGFAAHPDEGRLALQIILEDLVERWGEESVSVILRDAVDAAGDRNVC